MDVYKEFVKSFLPEGVLEYFELTSFKKSDDQLAIYLEESEVIPEEFKNLAYRKNGFLDPIKVSLKGSCL